MSNNYEDLVLRDNEMSEKSPKQRKIQDGRYRVFCCHCEMK